MKNEVDKLTLADGQSLDEGMTRQLAEDVHVLHVPGPGITLTNFIKTKITYEQKLKLQVRFQKVGTGCGLITTFSNKALHLKGVGFDTRPDKPIALEIP